MTELRSRTRTSTRRRRPRKPIAEVLAQFSRDEIERRFYANVDMGGPLPAHRPELGPCYVWTGETNTAGYGRFHNRLGAHRVAIWLETGEEPGDRDVLHHCDNPPCVRGSHLHFGSHRDNMAEMAARGRAGRVLKLTDQEAEALRQRYAAGEPHTSLAREFGISQQQASRIVSGRTRKLPPVRAEFHGRGLKSARQKLTDAQRAEIKRRSAAGERHADLAREFAVGTGYVAEVVHGRGARRDGERIRERIFAPPLAPEVVRAIRADCSTGGMSQSVAARKYGTDPSAVSRILAGISYRDVI